MKISPGPVQKGVKDRDTPCCKTGFLKRFIYMGLSAKKHPRQLGEQENEAP